MTGAELDLDRFREHLARTIHDNYRASQAGLLPPDSPAMQPWEQLREDLKESNRQQADQIPEKLRVIGYGIRPAAGGNAVKFGFSRKEVESLSQMEHRRWMNEKLAAGWQFGSAKDPVKKTHPSLVPGEELPEAEKKKDRQAVLQIPELLAQAGFEIYQLDLQVSR